MGIVVLGAVFVDIKGYPSDVYIPGGRNAGRVEQMHGGVSRNIVEDIANVELQPTFIGLWTTPAQARMWCASSRRIRSTRTTSA